MRTASDLLYTLFEQHLYNAIVEEETSDQFVDRVVTDYVNLLSARGSILVAHRESIEADLRDEVLEMLRKKTYGHYNLSAFRKALAEGAIPGPEKTKARRGRRAS